MLAHDKNAASVDTKSVSSKIGSPLARNAGPNSCRLRAMTNNDGFSSERASFLYRHGNLHIFSARSSSPMYTATANEVRQERCATYYSTHGQGGSTDVLCSQTEKKTISRQWMLIAGSIILLTTRRYVDIQFCC